LRQRRHVLRRQLGAGLVGERVPGLDLLRRQTLDEDHEPRPLGGRAAGEDDPERGEQRERQDAMGARSMDDTFHGRASEGLQRLQVFDEGVLVLAGAMGGNAARRASPSCGASGGVASPPAAAASVFLVRYGR
jgi:hypothetical protein